MTDHAAFTDIHNHLVPGVDDGAQSVAESLRHLTRLFAEGVGQLAVSPHLFGWLTEEADALTRRLDRLEAGFAELQDACSNRTDVPRLFFGQEILCQSADIARAVFAEPRAGYRGTDYALVEFGFDLRGDVSDVVHAVIDAGRRILVSHPERYRRAGSNIGIDELRKWKLAGAALQINASSLLGDHGAAIEALAWQALSEGLADVVATDHHADYRVVSPRAAYQKIVARGGTEAAPLLLGENPSRVIANRELAVVEGFQLAG